MDESTFIKLHSSKGNQSHSINERHIIRITIHDDETRKYPVEVWLIDGTFLQLTLEEWRDGTLCFLDNSQQKTEIESDDKKKSLLKSIIDWF